MIFLLALLVGLVCREIDFVTAFLNGPTNDVDMFMDRPD